MPRGRKKKVELTIDQKIEALEAEIQEFSEAIKEKKAELKNLLKEKEEAQMASIMTAVKESGKTVEEVIEFLKN